MKNMITKFKLFEWEDLSIPKDHYITKIIGKDIFEKFRKRTVNEADPYGEEDWENENDINKKVIEYLKKKILYKKVEIQEYKGKFYEVVYVAKSPFEEQIDIYFAEDDSMSKYYKNIHAKPLPYHHYTSSPGDFWIPFIDETVLNVKEYY